MLHLLYMYTKSLSVAAAYQVWELVKGIVCTLYSYRYKLSYRLERSGCSHPASTEALHYILSHSTLHQAAGPAQRCSLPSFLFLSISVLFLFRNSFNRNKQFRTLPPSLACCFVFPVLAPLYLCFGLLGL